ncbi:MAG: amidohydrolase [Bryobacterales bacterium]|nr:amidohydrolase [Bryobacterales bacterium]
MLRMRRRAFLPALASPLLNATREQPELILYNANILTINRANPRAQAVAIAHGRFIAVGSNNEILPLATAGTKKINLESRTVTPGFIDAHSHPASSGRRHLKEVDCDLRSVQAIVEAVQKRAAQTPKGQWILGFKYDDTKTEEGRALTRHDLDRAAPNHPVFINHRGGHTAYVNSAAFKAAGVTESTPDPSGGQIDRDPATKRLTGKLRETAMGPFYKVIPSAFTRSDYREGVKIISQMMTKTGVTSVHDAYGTPEDLRAYQDARDAGELGLRVYCLIGSTHIDQMIAAGVRTGLGDEWVRVGAMKMTCDGSISERTARLSQPYTGRPGDFGILVTPEAELLRTARKAHDAGWQIGIHANGDVAIDIVLRIYERLQREAPRRDPRFRIEHCTVLNPSLIRRIHGLGVIPTPFSTYVYYHGEKMHEYGPDRLNWMFALRSLLDAGVRPTQASDYPPGPFEPMMALQSSVTRTDSKGAVWGPKQKVTAEEAIRIGTLHGAYESFEEHHKGSIEPGKLADLVVLGRDPLKEPPSSLITIPVERTMTGGRWIYES